MHFDPNWRRYLAKLISLMLLITVLILSSEPLQGSETRSIISSQSILARINNHEPVICKSAIIQGDLNLSNLNSSLQKPVDSSITIVDCDIKGIVYFDRSIFRKSVNFEKTRFFQSVSFDDAQFLEYANFDRCSFFGLASFSGAKFRRSASFWRSSFMRFVTFKKSEFLGKMADFQLSEFRDDASFNFANFDVDKVIFENSNFCGDANFQQAKFNGDAVFLGARFKDTAEFSESRFNASSQFLGTRFDKELYFYNVKFKNFDINWDSVHNNLISDEQGYILLINNFKGMGEFDNADSCYYQFREWKRQNRPPHELEGKFWDLLAWISCGYGVRWTHPILSGVLVTFLFGTYYWISNTYIIFGRLLTERNSIKTIQKELLDELKRALLLSIICLLSLTGEWYPYGKEEFSKFVRGHFVTAILERLIGWGLVLLLIGTLTRLMVRY
jgi:uncharacterized protein YjbI with pentapeptide repeats